jgi:hypothetical protein
MIMQNSENGTRNPRICVDGSYGRVRMNSRFSAAVPEPFAENRADISQGVSVWRENQKAHPDWHPNGPDHNRMGVR